MAIRQVLVDASPERVWAVLADGWSYEAWVVGTRKIRSVDPDWPALGSALDYTAGFPPFQVEDRTVVRRVDPGHRLELEVQAPPLGSARVAIELIPWGDATVVVLDEHPLRGLGARLHTAPVEFLMHQRNRRMLANLARLVTQDSPSGQYSSA